MWPCLWASPHSREPHHAQLLDPGLALESGNGHVRAWRRCLPSMAARLLSALGRLAGPLARRRWHAHKEALHAAVCGAGLLGVGGLGCCSHSCDYAGGVGPRPDRVDADAQGLAEIGPATCSCVYAPRPLLAGVDAETAMPARRAVAGGSPPNGWIPAGCSCSCAKAPFLGPCSRRRNPEQSSSTTFWT
eukprot:364344-Chlamydomonas_euryale.AAC.2